MELKPCPFCGSKPHHITADLLTRPCFYYECENKTCHAAEKGWHDTEQEAIDAWNTRPIEDALRSRIAELEKRIILHENLELGMQEAINEMKSNKKAFEEYIAELGKEVIIWHKYPDEKPDLKPIPSIKLHTLLAVVSAGGDPEVEMVIVEPTEAMLHWRRADGGWYASEQILYWAYLPEPPRE